MKQKTLDAFVESQLKALGIKREHSAEDVIYARLTAFCKNHRRAAKRKELSCKDFSEDRVGKVLSRLISNNRAIKMLHGKYIPVVKP